MENPEQVLSDSIGQRELPLGSWGAAIHKNAVDKGFYEKFHKDGIINFGERIFLIVSELSEVLEADRTRQPKMLTESDNVTLVTLFDDLHELCEDQEMTLRVDRFLQYFKAVIRGSVEEELSDSLIRILDMSGAYKFDIDKHVELIKAYSDLNGLGLNTLAIESFENGEFNMGEILTEITGSLMESYSSHRILLDGGEDNDRTDVSRFKEATDELLAEYVSEYQYSPPWYLAGALWQIEELAKYLKIDLMLHVPAKMYYNSTRPAKHGKSY